jgi:translocation and assembly module TamA
LQGGVPVGGRSALELGLEMRIRITDTLGLVPFVDGGQVEDDMFIGDVSNMQYAAGLGFRYFTAVGPLRLDIAFPINRRKDVDSLFEFYVSLGQSF